MTLASDLVEETRSLVLSGAKDELNRLTTTTNTSIATIVCDFAQGSIGRGSILAIDLELMYVWSFTGSTATVQRAYGGTTGATHTAGALIYVNPEVSTFRIFQTLNEELASYTSPRVGLYKVATVDLTYNPSRSGYNLASVTNLLDVISVEATGVISGELAELRSWRLVRNAVVGDFASGLALELFEGGYPGKTIRVTYKTIYTPFALLADNVETTAGLHAQAHDIPPLGAAARLVAAGEVRRASVDTQPEPRAAADVPPGSRRNAAAGLLAIRNQRLIEEQTRLDAMYPHAKQRLAG